MNKLDFGIITPSYAPDFERCKLLTWSIEQFISTDFTHYIVVPARDLPLFRQLQKPNTEIITVESILPWWIQRSPFGQNWWLSLKNFLIRGWIIQQIVKLAAAQYVNKDVLVFIDSDVTFVQPFNLERFIRSDQVRLFRVPPQIAPQTLMLEKWHRTATQLLGLPATNHPVPGYIGQIMTWRRDNLLQLYQHIENISGRNWIETVCSSWDLSEYVLYGVFVDQVLGRSQHYFDKQRICHEYWSDELMSDEQLQEFFREILPEDIAVMISAKAGISVQRYQDMVKNINLQIS